MEDVDNIQAISQKTVLQAPPELFIDVRNDEYLILNPLGPWWFIGSKLHSDFIKLCNGKRSVQDIFELLLPYHKGIKIDQIIRFVRTIYQLKFFSYGEKQPIHPCNFVHFYITRRCNLTCPFCFYDTFNSKENSIEIEAGAWIKLAKEISKINSNAIISVTGGEPLIRNDAIDIIEGIAQYNLQIRLITNGTLLTENLIKRMSEISKLKVQISIDSLIPEENARTRGKGCLEKSIKAVDQLLNAGIKIGITSTVTQINKRNIFRMKRFCEQRGIEFGTSYFFMSGGRSKKNATWLDLKPDEIIELAVLDSNTFKEKEINNSLITPGKYRSHCGIGYGQLSIQPEGFVSPCRLLLNSQFYLGNIKNTELRKILSIGRQKYDFMEVDRLKCGCATCPVRYLCVGGCKANSFYSYGLLDQPPPNCSLLKKIYIGSLWMSISRLSQHSLDVMIK